MRLKLLLLLAACALAQASTSTMRDYVIRGYMQYTNTVGGASCDNSFVAACARMGRFGLRSSDISLRVLPPASGWAMLNGTMIGCPDSFAEITSSGQNQQASGVFRADVATPALVPATPFAVTPGGTPNSLQIRTLNNNCIYEFTLTEGTSYILGVQPVKWVSVLSRANAARVMAFSPVTLLVGCIAAVAALR